MAYTQLKDKQAAWKRYYLKNKAKVLAKNEAYRKANPKLMAEYTAKYKTTAKGAERIKQYYLDNKEKIDTHNRQYNKDNPKGAVERMLRYQKAHPERVRVVAAARRARKLNATDPSVDRSIILVFYKTAQRVSKCIGIKHHVDHIIPPFARGTASSKQPTSNSGEN